MDQREPSREEWKKLYQAADRVYQLSPWEWMDEVQIFGFENPETGELDFISIMGALGEHYSVAIYQGLQGLYGFIAMQESGPDISPEMLLQTPQLQASWEDRDTLEKEDREQIKALGLKYRGRNAWPMFRSYRPGFIPYFIEAEEARLLTYALEQVLEMAPHARSDPSILGPRGGNQYLIRRPRRQRGQIQWEDEIRQLPPPEAPTIDLYMDMKALKALKRLPRSRMALEVDFFMIFTGIKDPGARPYYPYMLLAVDSESGMILGSELLRPIPSLEKMWGDIPMKLVEQLGRVSILPATVKVRDEFLKQLLQPLAEELGFSLKVSKKLRMLDPAKRMLLEQFE